MDEGKAILDKVGESSHVRSEEVWMLRVCSEGDVMVFYWLFICSHSCMKSQYLPVR